MTHPMTPGQPTGTTEHVQAEPAPDAGPVYLSSTPRSTTIALEHPFALRGREYREVTVRRCTGLEVANYIEAIATAGKGERPKPPMVDCSAEVYAALDDDDLAEVDKAVTNFLPRRFRAIVDHPPLPGAE